MKLLKISTSFFSKTIISLLFLFVLTNPVESQTKPTLDNMSIAYLTNTEERNDVYTMTGYGENQNQVTHYGLMPFSVEDFNWSPDGLMIVYATTNPNSVQVIENDGYNQEIIIDPLLVYDDEEFDDNVPYFTPLWSPSGESILVTTGEFQLSHDANYTSPILLLSTIDYSIQSLTEAERAYYSPNWSPDGQYIACVSEETMVQRFELDIFIMKSDGTEKERLTWLYADDIRPEWSPFGDKIVFEATLNDQTDIYVVDLKTKDVINLTNGEGINFKPSWSPFGGRILFVSETVEGVDIYTIKPDGTDKLKLTINQETDDDPSWSPDGRYIAYVSFVDENFEVFRMNADGSFKTRLTFTEDDEYLPKWSPAIRER